MFEFFSSLAVMVWFLLNCAASATDSVNESTPCLCLKKVVDQLYNPVEYVTSTRNNSLLTMVVEQRGVVRAFIGEHKEREPVFMNITDRVTTSSRPGDQRGLLSLALHPHYNLSRRGRVFAYYVTNITTTDDDTERESAVVSEFQAYDDVVDVTSEKQLLHVVQPTAKNNGGQLLFGDDGYLYIFTGDGVGHDETVEHAQDLRSFLGKALRVDVDKQGFQGGGAGSGRAYMYDVPPDNPFRHGGLAAEGPLPEIFALGFFNPWRCSQDSASRGGTGAIFCGDTGTNRFEEINIVKKEHNYGWNLKEGDHCYYPLNCSQIEKEGVPIHSYNYSKGSAVVGGFVYRGSNFSTLVGQYVYGDAVSGETYLLRERAAGGGWDSRVWPMCPEASCPCYARASKQLFLLTFGLDPQGELMLLMTSDFSALLPKGVLYHAFPPSGHNKKPVTCGASSTCLRLPHPHTHPLLLLLLLMCLLTTLLPHIMLL